MELEDLKNTWQSVKTHIDYPVNDDMANKIASKRNDIKSRLLKRAWLDGIFTIISLVLMATSPLWSPMKFPYWWLAVFCTTVFIGIIYGFKIYRSIKAINLWEDTNTDILKAIISIKKQYRNSELAISVVIIPLLIWLSLTPLFIHSWRMFFTWGLTLLGFTLEYLWYNSNVKQLDNLLNWEKEE